MTHSASAREKNANMNICVVFLIGKAMESDRFVLLFQENDEWGFLQWLRPSTYWIMHAPLRGGFVCLQNIRGHEDLESSISSGYTGRCWVSELEVFSQGNLLTRKPEPKTQKPRVAGLPLFQEGLLLFGLEIIVSTCKIKWLAWNCYLFIIV